MQRETSNDSFLEYGQTYREPIRLTHPDLIHQHQTAITRRYVSQFYCFNCDTYIEVHDGIGVLLVSHTADAADVQEFAMNRLIHIKPNVYFAVVSTTQKLEFELYAESNYSLHVTDFPSQYEFLAVLPRIEMQKILGYYYRIRTPNYCFKGEQHNFFELTYVDEGELETEVDGTLYQLKDKELMIYGPSQFHTQYTDDSHNASYMTVLFDMRNLTPVEQEVWYDALINRVFHYDQKINSLIKAFVRESTTGIPYMNSLMLCLLTEIIIRLLQGTYASPMNQPSNSVHKSAMDELFDRIIAYIDENIYLPLTIPEICEHFSLSRTALQLMFKNSIDQSPKKYINDKKLERSCQMLLENRYTISEISLRLGYTSIHYFSKSFNMKYHMSPSEFVKQNLQNKK